VKQVLTESECLDQASGLLDVDRKYLQPFLSEDPLNPGTVIEGALCQKPNHLYGALAILCVNAEPCPQKIYATPKLHYPFGKDGSFHFPPVRDIHCYEKLDGTNVLSYSYHDADGGVYRSYKLRLAPFLRNGKWGDFLDMWKSLMSKTPAIVELSSDEKLHVSYEMYGSENEHLVKYETGLAAAALFAVNRHSGELVAPFDFPTTTAPLPKLLTRLDSTVDPTVAFAKLRVDMESLNQPAENGKISGTEGSVWYVRSPNGKVSMWKCKPESIEEIHWATGINKEAVLATCWNLLESSDTLTFEALHPLLMEEYQSDDIEKFKPHIDDCLRVVEQEQHFRLNVKSAYEQLRGEGLDIKSSKGEVMRALSKKFPKDQMSKVYSAIVR
jgi:hypothetical protein